MLGTRASGRARRLHLPRPGCGRSVMALAPRKASQCSANNVRGVWRTVRRAPRRCTDLLQRMSAARLPPPSRGCDMSATVLKIRPRPRPPTGITGLFWHMPLCWRTDRIRALRRAGIQGQQLADLVGLDASAVETILSEVGR